MPDVAPSFESARPLHLIVVPHTHWDREWYQPFQEFRARLVRLLDRLLDTLEHDGRFAHFHLDGQTIVLEDYLDIRPQQRSRLRRLIGAGRIAVGPWYVLPDELLISGESLIRNLQIGHQIAAAFGAPTKIGYLPDEFGHTAQMPQILAGFGIDSAVVWRGVGADVNETLFTWEALDGTGVLAVYLPVSGYSNGRNLPEDAAELRAHLATLIAEQAPYRRIPSLLVLNGTDHQEPQARLPGALAEAVRDLEGVTCEIAPLARFIERARCEHGTLQLHRGELRSPLRANVIPGVTSVRVRQKQRDFELVSRLERYAEPLATWAELATQHPGLNDFTRWAWKLAVQNHPHDSICGCSIDQVHRDMEFRFDQLDLVVAQVVAQALAALVPRLETTTTAPDAALVIYNPNGGGPSVVSAELHLDGAARYVLVDAHGHAIPMHVDASASEVLLDAELPPQEVRPHVLALQTREFLGLAINDIRLERQDGRLDVTVTLDRELRGRLDLPALRAQWLAQLDDPALRSVAVLARTGVPARVTACVPRLIGHGFTVFALRRAGAAAPAPFALTDRQLENEHFRIAVNDDGSLRITDKATGLVLPRCNWFVDEGDRGDEYNFDPLQPEQTVTAPAAPPSISIDADNPVVATLTVTQVYELPRRLEADRDTRSPERAPLSITTAVRLYTGARRIDFQTTVDNTAADHRLRVHFQTPLVVPAALMEQAFGTVERPLALEPPSDFERAVGAGPQRTFTCIQDGSRGVAVFNRGIPEVEVRRTEDGTEIALTLIRAVGWLSRGDLRYRHGPAGPGLETPDAQSPGTHRFQYALTTFTGDWERAGVVAQAHAFAHPPIATLTDAHPGSLPDAALADCDNPQVVLSAATPASRPGTFLLRWYNSSSAAQAAQVTIPLAQRVRLVNFLEHPTGARARRVGPQRWRLQLRPFEIVTLLAKTAPS